MLQPGRNANAEGYRYGFQGQEMDNEIKGTGNSVNYKYRMHDPRIGRFFAVDPLTKKYPHYSPYSFSGNKVIQFVELEGLEESLSMFMHMENLGDPGYADAYLKTHESGALVTAFLAVCGITLGGVVAIPYMIEIGIITTRTVTWVSANPQVTMGATGTVWGLVLDEPFPVQTVKTDDISKAVRGVFTRAMPNFVKWSEHTLIKPGTNCVLNSLSLDKFIMTGVADEVAESSKISFQHITKELGVDPIKYGGTRELMNWKEMTGKILEGGEGSTAVIDGFSGRVKGEHAFNAVVKNGKVVFLDGQQQVEWTKKGLEKTFNTNSYRVWRTSGD